MTAPSYSPLGELWQSSRMGVKVVRNAERPAPTEWQPWLREMFPRAVTRPFAPHHHKFWDHIWAIDYTTSPRPFFGIWPREGGKSTNVECACVALGARSARRYILYVRRTQQQADNSVANIASKLESDAVAVYYPKHGTKLLNKFGNAKGWRRNRVRTAGGLTIDALGLDSAARGAKVDDDRPDVIIFDDIDEESDTPATTAKLRKIITTSILPAGAQNVAVLGIQNLIIADGIFTTIVDGRADFLADRVVSGPHKAIVGLKTESRDDPETKVRYEHIIAGTPTWEGQGIDVCQRQIKRWGFEAFKREAQHEVKEKAEGLAINFDEAEHFVDLTAGQVQALVRSGEVFGGMDFGSWRFFWVLFAANEHGIVTRVDELFSQREELSVRARRIHDKCVALGLIVGGEGTWRFAAGKRVRLWGDAANPTDITEINAAWKKMGSPLRVVAVAQGNKIRKTAVDRINEHLGNGTLKFVRSVGAGDRWLYGYNAAKAGTTMRGSRLIWEMEHWTYPIPQEGKVDLKQDPDDHTADGADGVAASRYALMSYWQPAKSKDEEEVDAWSPENLQAEADRSRTLKHRLGKSKTKMRRSQFADEDEE